MILLFGLPLKVVTDQYAIGTLEAVVAYASRVRYSLFFFVIYIRF